MDEAKQKLLLLQSNAFECGDKSKLIAIQNHLDNQTFRAIFKNRASIFWIFFTPGLMCMETLMKQIEPIILEKNALKIGKTSELIANCGTLDCSMPWLMEETGIYQYQIDVYDNTAFFENLVKESQTVLLAILKMSAHEDTFVERTNFRPSYWPKFHR